jgi:hypothetical protein
MAFKDDNNTVFEDSIQTSDTKEIKFSLLENRRTGQLRVNIREFTHTDTYDGPTKNGMTLRTDNVEDVEKLQKIFNDFFEGAKKFF